MEDIKLKVKLSAYAKGIIPNVDSFIEDVPDDEELYIRKYKTWQRFIPTTITVDPDSGLIIEDIDESTKKLILNQWIGKEEDLAKLKDNTIYYIIENKADTFIDGGTAFSDEQEDYMLKIIGGNANSTLFDINLVSLNSRGE